MKPFIKIVLLIAFIAGTLDMIAAYVTQFIKTGKFAAKMFHYIAGGALGLEKSMKGGFGVVLLGIFFHYFIAFAFTLFFFLVYPKIRFLRYNKYLSALLVGIFMVLVMSAIVLPLTPLPQGTWELKGKLIGVTVLTLVCGVPISFGAFAFYKKQGFKNALTN